MDDRVRALDDTELFESLDWNRYEPEENVDIDESFQFDRSTTVETARHVGHMDILRELTDGQTGDQ